MAEIGSIGERAIAVAMRFSRRLERHQIGRLGDGKGERLHAGRATRTLKNGSSRRRLDGLARGAVGSGQGDVHVDHAVSCQRYLSSDVSPSDVLPAMSAGRAPA